MRTGQVLVEGSYSGLLAAGRHYIAVKRDLSDLGDALEMARDPIHLQGLADRAYEEIVVTGVAGQRAFARLIGTTLGTHGLTRSTEDTRHRIWQASRRAAELGGLAAGLARPGHLLRRR
jgi:hypothetical protein